MVILIKGSKIYNFFLILDQDYSQKENLTPPTTPYYNQIVLTQPYMTCSDEISTSLTSPPKQTVHLDTKQHLKKALDLALIQS